jgi:hypothetical protein
LYRGGGERLPFFSTDRLRSVAGALMSYAANFEAVHREAAIYIDKILKGSKPAGAFALPCRTAGLVSFHVVPAPFGRYIRAWLPIAREEMSECGEPTD